MRAARPPDGSIARDGCSLLHMPQGRWAFDEAVTQVFGDMLQRSIPQYGVMRHAVFDIAHRFVRPGTDIVDLGCSRGDALAPFLVAHGDRNRYVGVETSRPMLDACRLRFAAEIASGTVRLHDLDLRNGYPDVHSSVTLAVLTLQFLPVQSRDRCVRSAYNALIEGGALIIVEKILGATPALDTLMCDRYYQFKREAGYSQEAIDRKRCALEGVLVPMTARWNEDLLRTAGFDQVDCFWRWMNFAAWVAVKA
jgi:tRNA (cmo5U34)-methyltransferase